jgi:questin oxidase-like protein
MTTQSNASELSRRRFMYDAANAVTMACISPSLLLGCQAKPGVQALTSRNTDAMDQALERLAGLAIDFNHGPMAAEALIELGRAEQVDRWVEEYKRRFTSTYPANSSVVSRSNWREALGDPRRGADWVDFMHRELKEAAWPQVVGQWASILAPGLSAAAGHGLIRTAHAVRSLKMKETPLRQRELAQGLGYWAAHYKPLPDQHSNTPGKLKLTEALARVPHLPDEKRNRGSVDIGLRSVSQLPEFAQVADLISLGSEPVPFLSELTETFSTVYLRNVHSRNAVALVHMVTGIVALRHLAPYLSPPVVRSAQRYGWQLNAAIYAVYGNSSTSPLPPAKEIKRDDLIDRAVAARDEHAIKFTEACLGEYAINPKPIYLQAASDAIDRLKL